MYFTFVLNMDYFQPHVYFKLWRASVTLHQLSALLFIGYHIFWTKKHTGLQATPYFLIDFLGQHK